MPVEVIMPKVDMDMAEGTLAVWHVAEGERVEAGAALFDIETDKAAMEVESPATGILRAVTAAPGATVPIGQVIALIQLEGETDPTPAGEVREGAAPARIAAPQAPGGADALTAAPAPHTGTDDVEAPGSGPDSAAPAPAAVTPALPDGPTQAGVRASPLARRLARERGLALARITGSGPRGRITRADVEAAAPPSAVIPTAAPAPATDPRAIADRLGIAYRLEPVSRMRRVIAARLTESTTTVPHFTLEADLRLDALLALRAEVNAGLRALGHGAQVSLTDCLVRAAALALIAVPEANASWAGEAIVAYDAAHVSVAVALEGGLVTPVVRRANELTLARTAETLGDLVARARAGRLSSEAMQGGSFSLSNLGMFGVRRFAAIINPPESMILAVGRGERRWIVGEGDQPLAATLLSVTLSCDHRVVDGATGARWLEAFREFVEDPSRLLDP